ncbi:hypothetical protein GCM10027259_37790 [Micromonospora palomenae]
MPTVSLGIVLIYTLGDHERLGPARGVHTRLQTAPPLTHLAPCIVHGPGTRQTMARGMIL